MSTIAPQNQRDLAKELKDDPTKIKVGMGATLHIMSDCYPFTIIAVERKGKLLTVQHDREDRDANGDPVILRDRSGRIEQYSLRKNGYYSKVGTEMAWYMSLTPGMRVAYRDMSR